MTDQDRFPVEPIISETISGNDLDLMLTEYLEDKRYRLFSIFPADSPREAIVEREANFVKLKAVLPASPPEKAFEDPTLSRLSDSQWHTGRAGMQYRDIFPNRLGGKLIVSHIRIPKGGPVADYVHFHDVRFQAILCLAGSCSLVYENAGEPFEFRKGDLVLQPPGIRHRVLSCSDGFEVFEIASPAEHPTFADHEVNLPNEVKDLEKIYGEQRFYLWRKQVNESAQYNDGNAEVISSDLKERSAGAVDFVSVLLGANALRIPIALNKTTALIFCLSGKASLTDGKGASETISQGNGAIVSRTDELFASTFGERAELAIVSMPVI